MVKILFASNNIVHFPTAVPGSTVGTYNATRVPYAIRFEPFQVVNLPNFLPSTTDETWFHFDQFVDSGLLLAHQTLFLYDDLGRLLYHYDRLGNGSDRSVLYNGTSSVAVNHTAGSNSVILNTFDIQYLTNILGMEARVYLNGTLVGTVILNSNPNGYGKPVRFRLGGGTQIYRYSQVLVADGDTRNARLNFLRPTGAGAYSNWQGIISSLIDEDNSTGLATIEANSKHSLPLSAYSGSVNISNIAIVTNTTRGINSPTKLKHLIRSGGVDYLSAELSIPQTLQYNITDTQINPATSLPWVSSDLSGIEMGFVSVA